MKISIIGAGNVGSTTALRLCSENLGEVILVDKLPGLAQGKALDLEDAQAILKYTYNIQGTDDIKKIKHSDIVVITAGFPRRPGQRREELFSKNAEIIKEVSLQIKELAPEAIVIVVTNPLDLMTYLALKITAFSPKRVLGMGISLDAARFANLIAKELDISPTEIEATVIGSHGEWMLPLARFTYIKGIALDKFLGEEKIRKLIKKTINRGAEIVFLLGSGSACLAPSAAIVELIKAIAKDQKRILGVSAYLKGEYGVNDVCIGVYCQLGREGIEKIIELNLNKEEKQAFVNSANKLKEQYHMLAV
ncbi:MAG: malate dehydrogenase [Candidatus Omnitrophica bacterium]|nr:malate dehydrogenase [Candidatus Omnitrophota bacterium]